MIDAPETQELAVEVVAGAEVKVFLIHMDVDGEVEEGHNSEILMHFQERKKENSAKWQFETLIY